MSTHARSFAVRSLAVLVVLTGAVLIPPAASADDDGFQAAEPGVTFGPRVAYFRAKGADEGSYYGGAQLRLHLLPVVAVEGSADYRQDRFDGTRVDEFPVQLSLLMYLAPDSPISPYVLGGVGWYNTHVVGESGTTNRYGPHAGAGLEAALSSHWTIDGDFRYLWTQSLTAPTTAYPAGKNFSDNGFMVTAALNYRF